MSDASTGGESDDRTDPLGQIVEGARSAARWLRRLPERVLHPVRRRRARRRLREASPDGPVLFVCHGNICRSPYAEAVFRRRARGRMDASSAGLAGPDRPSPETALRVAGERGVDLEDHRSDLVTDASLREAGLVVVMDPNQARALRRRHGFAASLVLGDLDPGPIRQRRIRDPIFQPPELFREVYARIDRCVDGMLDALGILVADPEPEGARRERAHAADGERRPTEGGESTP